MKLLQWIAKNKVYALPWGKGGAIQVYSTHPDLWRMSDYAVSSTSSGPSVILIAKTTKRNPRRIVSTFLSDHAKSIGKRAAKSVGRRVHAAARKLSNLHARDLSPTRASRPEGSLYAPLRGARRNPARGRFYDGSWEHDRDDVLGIARMIAERDPNFPGVREVLEKYGKRAKKTITAKFALYARKGARGQWKWHSNYATESMARENARALAAKGYTMRCERI